MENGRLKTMAPFLPHDNSLMNRKIRRNLISLSLSRERNQKALNFCQVFYQSCVNAGILTSNRNIFYFMKIDYRSEMYDCCTLMELMMMNGFDTFTLRQVDTCWCDVSVSLCIHPYQLQRLPSCHALVLVSSLNRLLWDLIFELCHFFSTKFVS